MALLKSRLPSSGVELPLLLPKASFTAPPKYFGCYRSSSHRYVSGDPSVKCPNCSDSMCSVLSWVAGPDASSSSEASVSEGGYVKGFITYMVMDDLVVKPMSTIPCITLIKEFKVQEIGDLEVKVIDFGMHEAIKLLNASLHSKKVLTDTFFGGDEASKMLILSKLTRLWSFLINILI